MPKIAVGNLHTFPSLKKLCEYINSRIAAAETASAAGKSSELPAGYKRLATHEDDVFFEALLLQYNRKYCNLIAIGVKASTFCVKNGALCVYVVKETLQEIDGIRIDRETPAIVCLGRSNALLRHNADHEKSVDAALKNLVQPQMRKYYKSFSDAERAGKEVAYAKHTSFETIREDWFRERGIDCYVLGVYKMAKVFWCLENDEIAKDWQDYHEIYVEYELIPREEKLCGKKRKASTGAKTEKVNA